jgi:glycosyltransferase involved in cell wall biosynthesis
MMPPLRVCVDATPLLVNNESGVSKFCRSLLSALEDNPLIDVSAFAVTWRKLDQLPSRVPRGIRVAGRPMPARPVRTAWLRLGGPPVEWFVGRADVIHGTNFVVPPTAAAARVVTVHDLTPVKYPELCDPASLVFRDFVQRAVQRGAWVHTHSRFVADEVVDVFNADPAKVRPIWSGVPDLGAGTTPGPDTGVGTLPDGMHRYLLAIGTVEPRKDLPGLVRAFDRIAAGRPDVALVIIGSEGWGSNALDEALSSLSHRDRILRLGYVSDAELVGWLRAATVLAYPSRYEGFGFPPLLAMSLGVPVVTTVAGSIPEVVGDAASLVPPDDVDALTGALEAVLDDPTLAARLRAAGRERAQLFTWERCAEQMADLYLSAAHAEAG